MRTYVFLVASFGFVACGDVDSTAEIGSNAEFAAEEEIASTSDALLSNAASVWLPMQTGNTWTFTGANGGTKTLSFSDVSGGIGWLDGMSREGGWTGTASSAPNTLYSWNGDLWQWEPLYRFGYAVTTWTIGAGCDKFTLRRTATDATVVVPAGSFTGARTIGYQHHPPITARCVVPVLSSVTFAPGVGPVMFVSGGGEKFTLKSAKVNGKTYPTAPVAAVTAKLVFDKSSYTNKSNTIRCITTPCPGNAENAIAKFTFSVTNGTSSSKTWQFSSGCQFDVQLVSSTGKVVKSASDGRFCTLSLTSVTLAPGQTKSYAGQLELAAEDGTQFEGSYSAKAFMIPRSGTPQPEVIPAGANLAVTIVPAVP